MARSYDKELDEITTGRSRRDNETDDDQETTTTAAGTGILRRIANGSTFAAPDRQGVICTVLLPH